MAVLEDGIVHEAIEELLKAFPGLHVLVDTCMRRHRIADAGKLAHEIVLRTIAAHRIVGMQFLKRLAGLEEVLIVVKRLCFLKALGFPTCLTPANQEVSAACKPTQEEQHDCNDCKRTPSCFFWLWLCARQGCFAWKRRRQNRRRAGC